MAGNKNSGRKRGRKPLIELDPNIRQTVITALSTGVKVEDACAYAGVSVPTFYVWCNAYPEFLEATTRARAEGRIGAAAVVRRAATGNKELGIKADPAVAMWYLERTDPSTWGRKDMLISLGLNGQQLKELVAQANAAGVDLASVFEAMINEFANVDSTGNRETES